MPRFNPRLRFLLLSGIALLLHAFLNAHADTVFMKDGRVIENAEKVRLLEGIVVYQSKGRPQSLPLRMVQRIMGENGETLYVSEDLRVERVRDREGHAEYIFYRNGKEAGRCYWDAEGGFHHVSGRIPDGSYQQFYDSGKLEREFSIRNGTLNGVSRVYYESGILEREGTFADGLEEGVSKLFFKDGSLAGKSEYRKGLKHGDTILYYPDESVRAVMQFVEGKADGEQRMFYPSGALEVRMHFRQGVKHGVIEQFYETGKARFRGMYAGGKLDGEAVTLYESGRVKSRKYFQKGRILRTEDKSTASKPADPNGATSN